VWQHRVVLRLSSSLHTGDAERNDTTSCQQTGKTHAMHDAQARTHHGALDPGVARALLHGHARIRRADGLPAVRQDGSAQPQPVRGAFPRPSLECESCAAQRAVRHLRVLVGGAKSGAASAQCRANARASLRREPNTHLSAVGTVGMRILLHALPGFACRWRRV
jgi:hypothetical protein